MLQRLIHVQASVPSYFICPISLELMRDPVTISSGQTFDRASIETWMDEGNSTCPVTRQPLAADEEPIPNHVLRRMIQSWCVDNKNLGVERISTPRQPVSPAEIWRLVQDIGQYHRSSDGVLDVLHRLHRLAQDQPRTRKHMLQAGALTELSVLLAKLASSPSYCNLADSCSTPRGMSRSEEALRLMVVLLEADGAAAAAAAAAGVPWEPTEEEMCGLARLMVQGRGMEARQNAATVVRAAMEAGHLSEGTRKKVASTEGLMARMVELIRGGGVAQALGTKLVCDLCCWNRPRVAAVEAGVADALAEAVADAMSSEGREGRRAVVEVSLKALGGLCQCAEGRAAVGERHVPAVVRAMDSVSERASRHAAATLWVVLKWAPVGSPAKRNAASAGAFVKALAVAQSTLSSDTRQTCGRIARALSDVVALPAQQSLRL